ncbi:hypothetical protein MAPG_09042 [Magnaporthiopsis poae ATCC 64411]|uniref:Uncharacterized protein n=1 Tax=Magnaporthiopsis poae (strain ATCC 64411 / 73-15) TaxID=644358 RepID=A0A0C4E8X2_MAGP6|nr:hypothetical protein MAPG_09042 [Magnaporthiopsis poae ATCC 64411]
MTTSGTFNSHASRSQLNGLCHSSASSRQQSVGLGRVITFIGASTLGKSSIHFATLEAIVSQYRPGRGCAMLRVQRQAYGGAPQDGGQAAGWPFE